MSAPDVATSEDTIDPALFEAILEELLDEYQQPHTKPWIVGFSGGKDSTLLAQLVVEMMLRLPKSRRKRAVHIVSNDTQVESPVVQAFVDDVLDRIRAAVEPLHCPITVVKTVPDRGQSFWANLIGRGYRAPTRSMRWCTDRLKIKPTGRYIRDTTSMAGGSVLLLGVRSAESSARAQSIEKHGRARLNDHGTVKGCQVYRPIADLSTDAVWAYLLQNRPPWGGSHRPLATLYRNALGGECPFVVDANDAPSCGESGSSRFGCWTCTVVDKDRSLANMVANGFEHLEPLVDYRDWIKEISSDPTKRMRVRRNGEPGLGPFTVEVRRLMLDRLLAIQAETGVPLISADDVAVVRSQWAEDESTAAIRKATILLSVMSNGADDDGWEPCAE